jgi:hypothetical protein
MSSTQDLQNFIQISKIRPPNQSPHEAQEEDERLSDEEMREANVKAVEEAREKGKASLTPRQREMARTIEEENPPKPKEMPLLEKDGGGDGGGGLAGGGTVAVASDPGVFTNTFGGGAKKRMGIQSSNKKKDKKDKTVTSGVTKADRFLRGEEVNQSRKSVQDFAKWVIEEARVGMIQLDARPENVNTNDINESVRVATQPWSRLKVPNPQGRRGNHGLAPGQQGYTRRQYDHHFNFTKMETISRILKSDPSVLSLLKALDTDVPIGVN